MGYCRGQRHKLTVSLIKAENLRAADWGFMGGKSDPYCTCQLSGRPEGKVKTQVVKSTLEPEWHCKKEIPNFTPNEDSDLEFVVYDHDLLGSDDVLGTVVLQAADFFPGGFDGTLKLESKGKKESTINVKVAVDSKWPTQKDVAQCFVLIQQARGLRGADWNGKSDPYVVVQVPRKSKSKVRTRTILGSTDPEWDDEEFEMVNFELGDGLEFIVYDWDESSADDELGRVSLPPEAFTNGLNGWLDLLSGKGTQGQLLVTVDLVIPPPTKPEDPAEHITPGMRKPAPFQLRCLDTGKVHRLAAYTTVGRSRRELDPRYDLILNSPGIIDVSRNHAILKCWCGADPSSWRARVYCDEGEGRGVGRGPGSGHAGGGTSVDNEPVELWSGTEVVPGSLLRFGIREMWVLEKAVIFQKSQTGEVAMQKARTNAREDPMAYRDLRVPSSACCHALCNCQDWDSFVRVVLEWCGEPDEAPCVDVIEILDECKTRCGRYEATSLEAQEAFSIRSVLQEVRMGSTIRLRLSADPCLLAPILTKLETSQKAMRQVHENRKASLFSGFG